MARQLGSLLEPPQLPPGFRYVDDLLSGNEQKELIEAIQPLPFKEFEFHGFLGKRRIVSYGWKYDFAGRQLLKVSEIPSFLGRLRAKAADFASITPEALQQAMVTEYSPGAGIGWHRDKGVFGEIIGISLGASCSFRLRLKTSDGWERRSIEAKPGSAYLLSGPSRTDWEHSIPPVWTNSATR